MGRTVIWAASLLLYNGPPDNGKRSDDEEEIAYENSKNT